VVANDLMQTIQEAARRHELHEWWRGLSVAEQENIYRLAKAAEGGAA
jgi:hypothetical protein